MWELCTSSDAVARLRCKAFTRRVTEHAGQGWAARCSAKPHLQGQPQVSHAAGKRARWRGLSGPSWERRPNLQQVLHVTGHLAPHDGQVALPPRHCQAAAPGVLDLQVDGYLAVRLPVLACNSVLLLTAMHSRCWVFSLEWPVCGQWSLLDRAVSPLQCKIHIRRSRYLLPPQL